MGLCGSDTRLGLCGEGRCAAAGLRGEGRGAGRCECRGEGQTPDAFLMLSEGRLGLCDRALCGCPELGAVRRGEGRGESNLDGFLRRITGTRRWGAGRLGLLDGAM